MGIWGDGWVCAIRRTDARIHTCTQAYTHMHTQRQTPCLTNRCIVADRAADTGRTPARIVSDGGGVGGGDGVSVGGGGGPVAEVASPVPRNAQDQL